MPIGIINGTYTRKLSWSLTVYICTHVQFNYIINAQLCNISVGLLRTQVS